MTTEPSEIREQLQSLLRALERREQDIASRRVPRISRGSPGRDSQSEPPDLHPRQLIWQIEEAYKDLGATKRNALPKRRGSHRGGVQAPTRRLPAGNRRLVAVPGALRLLEEDAQDLLALLACHSWGDVSLEDGTPRRPFDARESPPLSPFEEARP